MLRQVLREIQESQRLMNLGELSRRLGIERSALEGMIAFWVRKGRLKEDLSAQIIETCTDGDCGLSCTQTPGCALIKKSSRAFSFVPSSSPQD